MSEVVRNPLVCWNRPILDSTRLTVLDIVKGIFREGKNGHEIYGSAFDVSAEDIHKCLTYCASLACKNTQDSSSKFCYRCTLDQELGINYDEVEEITRADGSKYVRIDSTSVFLGSIDEFWESEEKVEGWLIAQDVLFNNLDKI